MMHLKALMGKIRSLVSNKKEMFLVCFLVEYRGYWVKMHCDMMNMCTLRGIIIP